jgi:hypothetical protein
LSVMFKLMLKMHGGFAGWYSAEITLEFERSRLASSRTAGVDRGLMGNI